MGWGLTKVEGQTTTLAWEYTPEDEALAVSLNGGFRIYREEGEACTWPTIEHGTATLVGEVSATERQFVVPLLAPGVVGAVCYEATTFWHPGPDPANESVPSNRVGVTQLLRPSWWGETVTIE